MGVTIHYAIMLKKKSDAPGFLDAARRAARARKWSVRDREDGRPGLEIVPHKRCETLKLGFPRLSCDEFIKTSGAPLAVHVAVVDFLRALEPRARKLKVYDEGEYWETSDRKLLKKHHDAFKKAAGRKPGATTFTLGSIIVKNGKVYKGPGRVVVVRAGA